MTHISKTVPPTPPSLANVCTKGPPHNPVYVRRVDPSTLSFSLSSHRHSYIRSERFQFPQDLLFIIINKPYLNTSDLVHSGCEKAHDWTCEQLADLFRTTHRVKRGQWCGDIELADYLSNVVGTWSWDPGSWQNCGDSMLWLRLFCPSLSEPVRPTQSISVLCGMCAWIWNIRISSLEFHN